MPNLKQLCKTATELFSISQIESPALSAEVLLANALGMERGDLLKALIMNPAQELSEAQAESFHILCKRRLGGEPVAYITGVREFYGREFKVTRHTLIPRPETELIIDTALAELSGHETVRFADLGTGSGCIAITLCMERPSWSGLAVDISAEALSVAKDNATRLGATSRLEFKEVDFLQLALPEESFDLICSNPPYVSEAEYVGLDASVKNFEPKSALVPGETGCEHFNALCQNAAYYLAQEGIFLMEFGCTQGKMVHDIFASSGLWGEVRVLNDFAGLDRTLLARKK